ncbi:MAG: UDP-N-acetylglucosamine 1-carboxyvinyltransferase [Parachlamydiales bacterium]|jgi:UDP-N-acetylglucosamine 1-carboxyvinyltransferase
MSSKIKIEGGTPLIGRIRAQGAKNTASKLLIASLISDQACTLYNVPNITEVAITIELCKELGSKITWDKKQKTIRIITKKLLSTTVSQRFSGANRMPILMLGALLNRTQKEIVVPTVGGDNLGQRPLNFHIEALRKLGATVEYQSSQTEKNYVARSAGGLVGTLIQLPYPSVGATENTILAAVKAKGTTIIKNAAIEPEIMDLILFLQKLGVNITVDVNRMIYIQETTAFYPVEHEILADRNEVASYALAAIATKGRVLIEGAQHLNMITFLNKLREIGGGFQVHKEGIEFFFQGELKGGLHIETDVHPGFMTDWQQPFGVLLTQCRGASVIHETVYEKRFDYIHTLKQMGAEIDSFRQCLGGKNCRFASLNHYHSIVIKGPCELHGKTISIPDLRAGFAYVMAALIAKGSSTIEQMHFLDRGYENIAGKLLALGAKISVKKTENPLKAFLAKDLL